MPDDNGGTFSGDGSVTWTVRTGRDAVRDKNGAVRKQVEMPIGNADQGRHNSGIDQDRGQLFLLSLKPPDGMTAAAYAAIVAKAVAARGNRVEILVRIRDTEEQCKILWGPRINGQTEA